MHIYQSGHDQQQPNPGPDFVFWTYSLNRPQSICSLRYRHPRRNVVHHPAPPSGRRPNHRTNESRFPVAAERQGHVVGPFEQSQYQQPAAEAVVAAAAADSPSAVDCRWITQTRRHVAGNTESQRRGHGTCSTPASDLDRPSDCGCVTAARRHRAPLTSFVTISRCVAPSVARPPSATCFFLRDMDLYRTQTAVARQRAPRKPTARVHGGRGRDSFPEVKR